MIKSLRFSRDAYVEFFNGKTAIAVTNMADRSITVLPVNKWGHNDDIDIADAALGQIIWPVKAATQQYKFLTSAATGLTLQSSSANDTNLSGTGAWTVKIIYQDEDGIEQESTQNMNGVTPVALPFDTLGIFRMTVESSGTGNINSGDITVKDDSGDILCIISAGEGQTQIAVQRIPSNVQGRCIYHNTYFPGGVVTNTATMRLRVKKSDGTYQTKWEPELTQYNPRDERTYLTGGIIINPGDWIYWECVDVGANDIKVSATFDLEFFDIAG